MNNTQNNPFLSVVLPKLEQRIGASTYELGFKETPMSYQNNQLVITIPNATWAEKIQKSFQSIIKDLFREHFNTDILITYNIVPPANTPIASAQDVINQTDIPAAVPALAFNPDYTFEKFIESTSNRFAYNTAKVVVKQLGARENNPFIIYSAPGLGKTHLLQAIGNEILKKNPSAKVAYMTGEDFVKEFVEFIFQKKHLHQ